MPIDRTDERLIHRRQFILARTARSRFSHWRSLDVASDYRLHLQPDLNGAQVELDDMQLTLIGYMFDPRDPRLGDEEILRLILSGIRRPLDIFARTEPYGGRWILILAVEGRTIVHADPAGLRQLCYTVQPGETLMCASQPGLIADELGLEEDPVARAQFVAHQVRPTQEHWWPGDRSCFNEIRHLLPNHYLVLEEARAQRFWPERMLPIERTPPISRAARLLRGQCAAMARRFPLAQSITAGFDSRVILAALYPYRREVFFYTKVFGELTGESPDVRIPATMLASLGLRHHAIQTPRAMSDDFGRLYRANVHQAHERWGNLMEGLDAVYPEGGYLQLSGIVSEVARCRYYPSGRHPRQVTPRDLARLTRMAETPFILEAFDAWLRSAVPVARRSGIRVLDLFHWEQRAGRWAASALLELDLVQETCSPYNHRELLVTLLSCPIRSRRAPGYRLYRQLIRALWPELLRTPINPVGAVTRLKRLIRNRLPVDNRRLL